MRSPSPCERVGPREALRDGSACSGPGTPMRWISHSSVTPVAACTRRRTSSPRPSRSAAVAVPVLIRKLQCFSDTCAPPRVRPRQPAASISSHAFMSGGLRKVEPPVRARTGCEASRAARISAMRAAIAVRRAASRAQPGAHHDSPVRQPRVAIGEGEIGRGKPALLAGARDDVRPVEARRDVAAIGAAVHHHRAADAAGNAGEEFQPGQPGRGGMFGHGHVERGGAGDRRRRLRRRSRRSRAPAGSPRPAARRRG